MSHMQVKLIIAGIVLGLSVSYLALAGASKGWVYYLDVDSFLAEARYHDQRVRLCGRVAEENLAFSSAELTASFDLVGPTQTVAVRYAGVIPEMFKPGADVVIEGRLGDDGVFHADVLMTKCASKYQAEEHAKRLEQGNG